MAKKKKPSTLYSILFMILLAVIFSGILAGLNIVTEDAIAENSMIDEQRAILKAVGVDVPDEEIQDIFDKHFKKISEDPRLVYQYNNQDESGYVYRYEGGALWGNVLGYIGINQDLKNLLGMSVYQNNETPGLGGRITEDWYQDQFRSLEVKDGGDTVVYKPQPGGNVDAITGATLTSNSMRDILNREIPAFIDEFEGGQYEK